MRKPFFSPPPCAIVWYFLKSRVNGWPSSGLPALSWDGKDAGLAVGVKAWPAVHGASALLGPR